MCIDGLDNLLNRTMIDGPEIRVEERNCNIRLGHLLAVQSLLEITRPGGLDLALAVDAFSIARRHIDVCT